MFRHSFLHFAFFATPLFAMPVVFIAAATAALVATLPIIR
jgi:hypothetical protein